MIFRSFVHIFFLAVVNDCEQPVIPLVEQHVAQDHDEVQVVRVVPAPPIPNPGKNLQLT